MLPSILCIYSVSYPLDHRALRSSNLALYPFIDTFWSLICCATPFWPHFIPATFLFSMHYNHLLSLPTCSPTCATCHIMSNPSFPLPAVSPLNNHNYPSWSKEIKAWLHLKGMRFLVSGKEKAPVGSKEKPAKEKEVAEWKRNAQKAASALLLSVEEQFRGILDGIEDGPIAIWTHWRSSSTRSLLDRVSTRWRTSFRSRSAMTSLSSPSSIVWTSVCMS